MSLAIHGAALNMAPAGPAGSLADSRAGIPRVTLSVRLPGTTTPVEPRQSKVARVAPSPIPQHQQALTAATVFDVGPSGLGQDAKRTSPQSTTPQAAVKPSISGPFGPWYYPARYLHRRVTPLKPIWPAYPAEAANVGGHVRILLLVDEYGQVDQHKILSSSPTGVFDGAVIEAFVRHGKYAPGMITGYPVKGQLLAEIIFEPGMPPQASVVEVPTGHVPIMGLPKNFVAPTAPAVPDATP